MTPEGALTHHEVPTPRPPGDPYRITLGPDGNLWFTEIFAGKIGRVTPSGTVTEFTVGGQPTGIAPGPDGRLWFADMWLGQVRSISTSGVLGSAFGGLNNPRDVVTGADGNLWVSEFNANAITRLNLQGSVTRFTIPVGSSPNGVAAGPDGNVWFTAFETVGRITPAGVITEFTPPTAGSWVFDIAQGPDGNMWFTQRNVGQVGRVTPAGDITEHVTPIPPGTLGGIAAGPDGNIWFTAETGHIGRVELAGDATPPVVTVPDDIVVDATGPSGAAVAYEASATDDGDGPVPVACDPPSGGVFPIGTSTVTCYASDAAGNEATASFSVHVKGARGAARRPDRSRHGHRRRKEPARQAPRSPGRSGERRRGTGLPGAR